MKERFFASHFINKEKSVNFARLLRLRQYKNKTYQDGNYGDLRIGRFTKLRIAVYEREEW